MMIIWDIVNFGLVALMFFWAGKNYKKLPKKIPIHFDLELKPDAYGNKIMVFLMPCIGFLVVLLMVIPMGETHHPIKITEENREIQTFIADIIIKGTISLVLLLLSVGNMMIINTENPKKFKNITAFFWILLVFSILFPIVGLVVSYFFR